MLRLARFAAASTARQGMTMPIKLAIAEWSALLSAGHLATAWGAAHFLRSQVLGLMPWAPLHLLSRLSLGEGAEFEQPRRHSQSVRYPIQVADWDPSSVPCHLCMSGERSVLNV
jgi:hypothetical protein